MKHMAQLLRISWRQVRHHLATYLGLTAVVAVTTILAVGELSLVDALRRGQFTLRGDVTSDELIAVRGQIADIQTLLVAMLVITATIAIVLVVSAARSVIYVRRVELRLFRLAGTSRAQLRIVLALEFFFLVAIVSAFSTVLGSFAASPLFSLYKALGAFGAQIELAGTFNPGLLGAYVLCQTLVVTLVGMLAYRERAYLITSDPASSQSKWRTVTSLIVRCVVFGGAVLVLFSTTNSTPEVGQIAVVLPLVVTAGMVALSPFLIPGITRMLALLLRPISPGIFRLLAATAWGDRARLSQVALPVIVAVGLLGGFMYASTADAQVEADTLQARYQFETQVNYPALADAQVALDRLHAAGDTSAVMVSNPLPVSNLNPGIDSIVDVCIRHKCIRNDDGRQRSRGKTSSRFGGWTRSCDLSGRISHDKGGCAVTNGNRGRYRIPPAKPNIYLTSCETKEPHFGAGQLASVFYLGAHAVNKINPT